MAFAVFKTVVGRFSASQVGSTPMHLRHSIENGPKIWRCIVSERQDIRRGESVAKIASISWAAAAELDSLHGVTNGPALTCGSAGLPIAHRRPVGVLASAAQLTCLHMVPAIGCIMWSRIGRSGWLRTQLRDLLVSPKTITGVLLPTCLE